MIWLNSSTNERIETFPEPQPDWSTATNTWSVNWDCHIYGFGASFFTLGLCNVAALCIVGKRINSQPIMMGIILLGMITSFLRSLFLFIDPYSSRGILPLMLVRMCNAIFYPCFAAMFSLLQFLILRLVSTKRNTGPQNKRIVFLFPLVYIVIVSAIQLGIHYNFRLKYLVLFDQGIFICWGLIFSFILIYNSFAISQFTSETDIAFRQFRTYSKLKHYSI